MKSRYLIFVMVSEDVFNFPIMTSTENRISSSNEVIHPEIQEAGSKPRLVEAVRNCLKVVLAGLVILGAIGSKNGDEIIPTAQADEKKVIVVADAGSANETPQQRLARIKASVDRDRPVIIENRKKALQIELANMEVAVAQYERNMGEGLPGIRKRIEQMKILLAEVMVENDNGTALMKLNRIVDDLVSTDKAIGDRINEILAEVKKETAEVKYKADFLRRLNGKVD